MSTSRFVRVYVGLMRAGSSGPLVVDFAPQRASLGFYGYDVGAG